MTKVLPSIYHFQELGYRLAYVALGSLLIFFTAYTYKQALVFTLLPQGLSHFVSTEVTEIFFAYIEICIFLSFDISLILIPAQVYLFLRPGLYAYEAKMALRLLAFSISFYISLYLFAFPWFVKLSWELFSKYSKDFAPIHLSFEPKIITYLDHINRLNAILIQGLLCIVGLNVLQSRIKKEIWANHRGITYLVSLIIAALITPPDILSQSLIGLSLIVFYEAQTFIWAVYSAYQKRLLIRKPIEANKDALREKEQP